MAIHVGLTQRIPRAIEQRRNIPIRPNFISSFSTDNVAKITLDAFCCIPLKCPASLSKLALTLIFNFSSVQFQPFTSVPISCLTVVLTSYTQGFLKSSFNTIIEIEIDRYSLFKRKITQQQPAELRNLNVTCVGNVKS